MAENQYATHRARVRRELQRRHHADLQETNWIMKYFREEKGPYLGPASEARKQWEEAQVPFRERSIGSHHDHPTPFYPGLPRDAWALSPVADTYGPPGGVVQRLDDPHANGGLRTRREVKAWNRLQDIKEFFSTGAATPGRNVRWVYQRLLGYGGCGIVTHFRIHDDDAKTEQDVAIKNDLRGWEDKGLVAEGEMMKNFTRSKHMVQTVPPDPIGKPPSKTKIPHDWEHWKPDDSSSEDESSGDEDTPAVRPPDRKRRKPRREQSNEERMKKRARWNPPPPRTPAPPDAVPKEPRKDYVVIEYLPGGDLKNLIAKVEDDKSFFPSSVLWQFFRCLLKQCIGLAYPVRKFHPDRMTAEGDLEEMIPPEEQKWRKKRFVHFDYDPFNIFIGEMNPGSDEHQISPILKLADFGLAEEIKEWKRDSYYLRRRRRGKFNFRAPEQFGDEWEFIYDNHDGTEVARQPVAGNYDTAMNVWGMGLTMISLVILGFPHQPPIPGDLPLFENVPEFISYGNMLLDGHWDYIDSRLRALISWCLAHKPSDRPTLEQLQQQIQDALDNPTPDDALPDPDTWIQDNIFGAPVNPVYFEPKSPRSSSSSVVFS